MPKKRNHVKTFKPSFTASTTGSSSSLPSDSHDAKSPPKGVNELLANLRQATAGPSSSRSLPVTSPSVPPAIREILQIPETPSPIPRRPVRQRFDNHGRRLPPGPAPPRSWAARQSIEGDAENSLLRSRRISYSGLDRNALPGAPLPDRGSLIDVTLKRLAVDWDIHRIYNQYHLYFVPGHLKAALIHYIGVASGAGVSLNDLKTVLFPPEDMYSEGELDSHSRSNFEVTCLDLSASIGKSLRLKDVLDLLFRDVKPQSLEEPQESWEAAYNSPSPPPAILLPNLTHLSLALDPRGSRDASWKQLLTLSSKLPTVTHLSLAHWPEPCLTPRSKCSTVSSPQGCTIPYGGTNIYSHSLDHDWSEALLVLRMVSNNFYKLEFLDLTGCAAWFNALQLEDGHDFVDWAGSWGKITLLRLHTGWSLGTEAMISDHTAFSDAVAIAKTVEKHIRAMRAGKGRFITVERDG
ncbi:hypothetical protein QQS21_011892 [Conoideocrella luteorostrata]|uniref:Tafazzin n=1 Tax=Conoideocrella luteorostrata TaxID=1105319 RepID=A0AAJ0CF08_9HYPO|nr:hypothetical protein QQS21_011892 [Conoideocrella luteorostrata]